MSAGVESILCVILGVSGILMPHPANSISYRGNYTVKHLQYDHLEQRIIKKEKTLDKESGLVSLIDNSKLVGQFNEYVNWF